VLVWICSICKISLGTCAPKNHLSHLPPSASINFPFHDNEPLEKKSSDAPGGDGVATAALLLGSILLSLLLLFSIKDTIVFCSDIIIICWP
jgi:hypothetical protein